jgi:WD40 repeat protein
VSRFTVGLRAVRTADHLPPPQSEGGFIEISSSSWPLAIVLLLGFVFAGMYLSGTGAGDHANAPAAANELEATVWAVAYSTNGRYFASATLDGRVLLEELPSGETTTLHQGSPGSIRALAFSSDSTTLAVAGDGPFVLRWNAATLDEIAPISGNASGYRSMAIAPDGTSIAIASRSGGTLQLLDWPTGRPRSSLQAQGPNPTVVKFSPDGRVLASGGADGCVRLWDVGSGRQRTTLRVHDDAVQSLAFSTDGRWLASAGRLDPVVRLWDVETGAPCGALVRARSAVNAVAFAPSGDVIATGHLDGAVCLWDAARGEPIAAVHDQRTPVWCLAFSPDGRTLTSGSSGRAIRVANFSGNVHLAEPRAGQPAH